MAVQLHLEDVLGGEEGVDVFAGERHVALAEAIEQRLQHVGQLGHVVHAEGRRTALDRVGGAKNRIQLLGVGRVNVEREQQPFFFRQQLVGFIEKNLEKLAHVDRHAYTPSACLSRCIMAPFAPRPCHISR